MRRRRGGLLGTAARTAVIAGTATSVSGRVARRQQEAANREAAAQDGSQQHHDHIEQLERLSRLHDSGALTDREFKKEKSRLIG